MPKSNDNEKLVLLTFNGHVMTFTQEEYKEFKENLSDNLHELASTMQ